jgi:Flavoprotein
MAVMPAAPDQPVLYLIACGAPPAAELPAFTAAAWADDWDVCVILSPDGTKFLDPAALAGLADQTGHPVRSQYKRPDEPDVLPPADVLAVAPATFNTINKWAQGISDTLALGLLNEAVGLGLPVVAVPWTNRALARHPAFRHSVAALRDCGVGVILDPARLPGAAEPAGAAIFPWHDLRAALAALRRASDTPSGS